MTRILLVEDDASLRRIIQHRLRRQGYEVRAVARADEALEEWDNPDITVTDVKMPGMSGIELLKEVRKRNPNAMVIVITAHGTIDQAVAAMKEGAFHYLTKPIDWEAAFGVLERAVETLQLRRENVRLREQLAEATRFEKIVGESAAMERVFDALRRVAVSDATVLILGESGTGKELVARAIHYHGPRSEGPFVAVNCGAIPADLVESELFGHEKGAFTGAVETRIGKFERASGGTLFLDEVVELPPAVQVKLLRVLQERTIERIGGRQPIDVDVRILAASNRSLEEAVDEGEFRADLYYRLNVIPIELPPLRQRGGDIPLLVRHTLAELDKEDWEVTDEAMALLQSYSWPGNVRELSNQVRRMTVMARTPGRLTVEDLPEPIRDAPDKLSTSVLEGMLPDEGIDLARLEAQLVRAALDKAEGNQTRAAELLGIRRHKLIYRMKKYGIESR